MAEANVAAILGTPPPPANPLAIMSGWQDLKNKVLAGQNLQLQNQTGQQSLATTMSNRHSQVLYGLSNLSDDQLQGGKPLYDSLNQELASGQIDQKRFDVLKQQIDATTAQGGGAGASYRPMINGLLATTMGGPEAARFLVGSPFSNNSGQGIQGGVQGGLGSNTPGGFQPQGQQLPTGLMSQSEGSQPVVLQTPSGPLTTTRSNFANSQNPGSGVPSAGTASGGAPAAIPGNGGYVAPGASSGGGGNVPAGIRGPAIGAEADINQNIAAYNGDQQQVPIHQTNVQNLQKAHDALEMVGTGAGAPQALSTLRSYAVGLYNATGFKPPEKINLQDAAAAELDKYLTAYARQSASGSGTNLDQQLSAASNASSHINPTAARSVINTNIGQERMAIALNQAAPQASTYLTHKSGFSSQYDPRAFAADMYTTNELQGMVDKMTPAEKQKFAVSLTLAQKMGLVNQGRQNQFKGGITTDSTPSPVQQPIRAPAPPVVPPVAPAPASNLLTRPPGNALVPTYGD